MSIAITIQRVHIEFSRVQTWLFAVPRLRAMVGAHVPAKRGEILLAGQIRGVGEGGLDVLGLERWILGADLALGEPIGQIGEHDRDHDPRAADAGFAMTDGWIDLDPIQKRLSR